MDALRAAKRTETLGYIYFPANFSESMGMLLRDGRFADESAFVNAELTVHIDMTGVKVQKLV